jgi:predicted Na+-dependent transporter
LAAGAEADMVALPSCGLPSGNDMSINLRRVITLPVQPLTWIGRQGTRAIAALVIIGVAFPPLGELLKPYVTEAIFLLLCISFLRVDVAALRNYLRRPGIVIAATVWTTIAVPLIAGTLSRAVGVDRYAGDVFLALMLQAVASPMMASPSLAALMGLDATLVLITLVTSTALVPITAPVFAYMFFGSALTLSPLGLGLKLALILAGSLSVASAIRWSVGAAAIARHKLPLDGLNIMVLLVFVSAVMGNVAGSLFADPAKTLGLTVLAFAVFFALVGASALIFRNIGRERALAIGLMVSQRNMGLMVAATDGVLPGATWLYFALSQFPIYWSPQLLKPMVRRLGPAESAAETADA